MLLCIVTWWCGAVFAVAQSGDSLATDVDSLLLNKPQVVDSLTIVETLTPQDSMEIEEIIRLNTMAYDSLEAAYDATSVVIPERIFRDRSKFVPDPIRSMWLGLIFPGGGQIYNRKYWKLPIIYGGFLGCMYALSWNGQMLSDYTQAYLDIMDNDPNTKSYEKMLPMGYDITGREAQFQNIFRRKKDYFRKYRDMSVFAFIGVYLISVVDAYVDGELSTFDISPDLSLHIAPAAIHTDNWKTSFSNNTSLGVQCVLNF